jgi:hypothetical protein
LYNFMCLLLALNSNINIFLYYWIVNGIIAWPVFSLIGKNCIFDIKVVVKLEYNFKNSLYSISWRKKIIVMFQKNENSSHKINEVNTICNTLLRGKHGMFVIRQQTCILISSSLEIVTRHFCTYQYCYIYIFLLFEIPISVFQVTWYYFAYYFAACLVSVTAIH